MSAFDRLLQSVIEAPDHDAPRMACADWFAHNGDPVRADFIRIQCSLDKLRPDDPLRPALQRQERELLDEHGWEWAEPFGQQIREWSYRRGFIEQVTMSLEASAD